MLIERCLELFWTLSRTGTCLAPVKTAPDSKNVSFSLQKRRLCATRSLSKMFFLTCQKLWTPESGEPKLEERKQKPKVTGNKFKICHSAFVICQQQVISAFYKLFVCLFRNRQWADSPTWITSSWFCLSEGCLVSTTHLNARSIWLLHPRGRWANGYLISLSLCR